MSVEKTECCNMHTKEKEKSGTCCQTKDEVSQGEEAFTKGMELQRGTK